MPHCKQDFLVPLKKVHHVINGFEGSKVHKIYEGSITWKVNEDYGNPHQVEIPKFLCVPKGLEPIISPQHWAQNSTYYNEDNTTLYVTRCINNHDYADLISVGGKLVCTLPLEKHIFHST